MSQFGLFGIVVRELLLHGYYRQTRYHHPLFIDPPAELMRHTLLESMELVKMIVTSVAPEMTVEVIVDLGQELGIISADFDTTIYREFILLTSKEKPMETSDVNVEEKMILLALSHLKMHFKDALHKRISESDWEVACRTVLEDKLSYLHQTNRPTPETLWPRMEKEGWRIEENGQGDQPFAGIQPEPSPPASVGSAADSGSAPEIEPKGVVIVRREKIAGALKPQVVERLRLILQFLNADLSIDYDNKQKTRSILRTANLACSDQTIYNDLVAARKAGFTNHTKLEGFLRQMTAPSSGRPAAAEMPVARTQGKRNTRKKTTAPVPPETNSRNPRSVEKALGKLLDRLEELDKKEAALESELEAVKKQRSKFEGVMKSFEKILNELPDDLKS